MWGGGSSLENGKRSAATYLQMCNTPQAESYIRTIYGTHRGSKGRRIEGPVGRRRDAEC